jgi:hypothetical protein
LLSRGETKGDLEEYVLSLYPHKEKIEGGEKKGKKVRKKMRERKAGRSGGRWEETSSLEIRSLQPCGAGRRVEEMTT